MGNSTAISRAFLWLALLLSMLAMAACVPVDAIGKQFDVPAQPAGSALNEFARQADITLIFSYDLVADDRTHAMKGRYTVNNGLAALLEGTRLAYRQGADGTYFICPRDACDPASGARGEPSPAHRKTNPAMGGGNVSAGRLHN